MKRRAVRVIRCRIEDLQVGDVVNRDPEAELGWFQIAGTNVLFDGKLQVSDKSEQLTISGLNHDIVGLQLVEELEVDAHGRIVTSHAPAAPPAPQPAPAQAAAPPPAPQPAPAPAAPAVAPAPPAADKAVPAEKVPAPAPAPAPAPVAEKAPPASDNGAGDAANGTADSEGVPDFSGAGSVDLGKVLNLLESLDAPEPAAPIRIEIADTPPGGAPAPEPAAAAVPEAAPAAEGDRPPGDAPRRLTADDVTAANARPVYGDAMPDTPSYKNPVVVDDGATRALPKRRSAA